MKKIIILILLISIKGFAEEITIGIASNFSEASSSSSNPYGNFFRDGIKLAIKNNQAKLKEKGISIKLQEFDYGKSQAKVRSAANKACDSSVFAVVGYVYSSHALLAAPIHAKCKLPFITPSASTNKLSAFKRYIHQGTFNNKFQGKILADLAKNRLKAKSILIVVAEDCAYCVDLSNTFQEEFKKLSGKFYKLSILSEDSNFDTLIKKAQKVNFDAILVPNHELASARVISALANTGIKGPFIGGDGWGNVGEQFFGILKGKKIRSYSLSHWLPSIKTKESEDFVIAYRKSYGKMPNDTAVLSYDSFSILIEAILNAKILSREGIENSLNSLKKFNGVTGKFIFRPGNAPLKSTVLLENFGDHFKVIDIINPSEINP